mgnify:FL=1
MKRIFLLLAVVCSLVACDPVSEDIANGGHITAEQLQQMSKVTVDVAQSGKNGNVISCTTSAPVNAKWSIGGKDFLGNYATKKMKVGSHTVTLTGLCADGTMISTDFTINCEEITDPLQRYWIYGEDPEAQPAFVPGAWDAAAMRFSDNEGTHLPYLTDDVYWGFKTLIFELTDVSDDCDMKVMNGWWSATYYDHVAIAKEMKDGKWELQLTEDIAKDCARGNGGSGKDLDLMLYSGSMTVHSIYYEE